MDEKMTALYTELDRLYAAGQLDKIEDYLREQIVRNVVCCGNYNPMHVAIENELGSFYRGQGRLQEAEEQFSMAARQIMSHLGANNIEYATTLNNLAGAQRMAGKNAEARKNFEIALRVYEDLEGVDSYLYTSAVNNFALLEISEGHYAEAVTLLEKAMKILEGLSGCEQEKAITLSNLGTCSFYLKEYDKAEEQLLACKKLYEQLPEGEKGHLAAVCNSLGHVYVRAGKKEDALKAFSDAKRLTKLNFGRSMEYAVACENIACVCADPVQAARELREGQSALEELGQQSTELYARLTKRLEKVGGTK